MRLKEHRHRLRSSRLALYSSEQRERDCGLPSTRCSRPGLANSCRRADIAYPRFLDGSPKSQERTDTCSGSTLHTRQSRRERATLTPPQTRPGLPGRSRSVHTTPGYLSSTPAASFKLEVSLPKAHVDEPDRVRVWHARARQRLLRRLGRDRLDDLHATARPPQSPVASLDGPKVARSSEPDLVGTRRDCQTRGRARPVPRLDAESGRERQFVGVLLSLVRLGGIGPSPLDAAQLAHIISRDRYSMIKARMEQDKGAKLNAGQHLLASATSGPSSRLPPRVVRTTDAEITRRRDYGFYNEPDLGRQDPDVYDARFARTCISRRLA